MLKREKIAESVHFNIITDPRYKFNRITFGFFTPLSEDRASLCALIPRLLCKNNTAFPEFTDFSNYLASLYNAKCDFEVESFGDTQFLGVSLNFMDDNFALHGEKITDEAALTLFNCIFRPFLEKGAFAASSVETGKREQIETIEAEINDKRLYASNQAKRVMYRGEPAAVNPFGDVEKTREITPPALFEVYKNLLKSAEIEIVCVGCNDFADALRIAKKEFSALERTGVVVCRSAPSPLKPNVEEVTERLPLNQSKMVLGFKSDSKNHSAITLMSNLYGGTISSKLFLNVREKLSLCYYCWSRVNRQKGSMSVSCGVEEDKITEAKAEILLQLETVQKGNFTDEELSNALMSEHNNIKTVNDSLTSLTWWYITLIYRKEIKTPEEYLKNYEGITREDVIEAANSMKLDTFYILSNVGDE